MRRVVFPALTVFSLVGLGCGQGAERASLKVGGGSPQRVEARERQEDAAALDEALTVARDRSPGAESLYRARLATAAQLPAERRAAAAAGIPLDPVRLAARLRVPAGDNAAELYRAFERAVRDSPLPPRTDEIAGRMGPGPTTVTPAEEARTSAVLARRSDLLVLISRITRRPECWFGYDLTRGFNVPTPEYAWMRRCARLLRGEAVRLARKGEAIRALTLLGQGFVIADHAAWQPGVIPYLVSVAIGSILLGGVDAVLQSAGSDPRVAATAAQTVAAWEPKLNLRRALADDAGLLCIGWAQVGQGDLRSLLTTGMVPGIPRLSSEEVARLRAATDAAQVIHLSRMHRLLAAAELPFPERLRRLATLPVIEEEAGVAFGRTAQIFDEESLKCAQAEARVRARREAVRAGALLLARFRASSFPPALEEAPTDPFDGAPLRYRLRPGGFTIYSVGPDGNFNGEPDPNRTSREAFFRYPASAPPPR